MAEINQNNSAGQSGKRSRLHIIKLDMTPMVDLAFLLLTFFILAATLAKPKTLELVYPTQEHSPVNKSANTLLLGNKEGEVYYYQGVFKPDTKLEKTNFTTRGLGRLIRKKNANVCQAIARFSSQLQAKEITVDQYNDLCKKARGAEDASIFIIKTNDRTPYQNVISTIDELNVNDARKYAVVDMELAEKEAIEHLNKATDR